MRWAREQHELLKLSVLLPLLLLFSVARLHCAAGQHVSETCPVNPFHSLEEPSSCASTYSTSSTAILRDAATQLNISATACPLTVNATNTPTNVDDRPPTSTSATESTVVEVQGTSATESKAYGVPLPSAVRSTKEDVWTEIDDSLGQSWTPELEAEYARAQREFELQTQAAAEPLEFAPTSRPEGASERKDATSVPEFPSFAEWKERHLAAGLAASIQAGKENRKDAKEARSPHIKEVKKLKAEDASNLTKDMEAPADEAPLSNGLDDLLSGSASQPHEGDYGDQLALAPHAQRVYHPVPHAGSGDPLLDPLLSLRDRTNYASFDCSATLIRSSKSTKFASAILSSKKDRYMLSPCSEKEKYVIVELCDEIQIDNIVLANLEFFSSMFKLFRVSGGTAYPESAGSWREIGTFRASNARGMQVRWSTSAVQVIS